MSNPEEYGGMIARPYQLRLLEHAIQHNSIIYLPTGSGKTYIALMLLRHFSKDTMKPLSEGGKRCIFACNTVELARQNLREISNVTNFKAGLFIGDMNVDNWQQEKWITEIEKNQIFVGTCQVFVDMVSHNYLSMSNLSCVIMDECHHATRSHPMNQFLSLSMFADKKELPRFVGLTGVLLKSSAKGDILKPLQDLEAVFRGKIITVENINEYHNVLLYSTSAKEHMITYADESLAFDIELQIESIISKCCAQLENWELGEKKISYSKSLQNVKETSKLKSVKQLLSDFIYQMNDMGLYTASVAIMGVIIQLEINKRNAEMMILRNMYRYILTQCEYVRHILIKKMKSDADDDDDDVDEAYNILNFSKPKIQALLSFFIREFASKKGTDISCLVFVERRYTAKCLSFVIKNFAAAEQRLKHIVPEFMVGRCAGMNYSIDNILDSKWNRQAVERFHRKECNLIVCSKVLEEGINVQACNYVIAFDPIKQFSSYVQMKGRARSRDSLYAVLCPKLKANGVANQIQAYKKIDETLKKYLITRTIDREIPDESSTKEQFSETIKPLITTSGAVLKASAALMLLHRYCQTLPHDAFTQSQVIWLIDKGDPFQVSLQLPPQSTIKEKINSDVMLSWKAAKISAAFNACVKLYQNGELNENLLPVTRKHIIENVSEMYFAKWKNEPSDNSSTAGTNKNHRIYDKIYPNELTAALPIPGEVAYAYCINITPEFSLDEQNAHIIHLLSSNSNYAIVLRHKLPALAPMPLFMTQGPLTIEIASTPFEFVITDENELIKLKKFNKMLFCDILSYWQTFFSIDNRNGPNSFLIAPVQHNCSIDWALVRDFPRLSPLKSTTETERLRNPPKAEDFLGKVVNTWYSSDESKRYVVKKIRHDLTPLSAFVTKEHNNFAKYIECTYNERVVNNEQFLIEVQPLTSRTNFFVNSAEKTSENKRMKRDNTIILIPELCHNFRFPSDLWLKAMFIGSILHRLYFLLNAEKLRVNINRYLGITTNSSYKPSAIQIDLSLRRVSPNSREHRSMLPALDTTHRDNSTNLSNTLVNVSEGNWKTYIEPIDVFRKNPSSLYPIEIDYYYQFVNSLLDDMEKLNLDDITAQESASLHLNAHKPNMESSIADASNKMLQITFDSDRYINMLQYTVSPKSIRTAEQFEFLAAITSAAANDVYDMERLELLGDSFLKFSVSLLLMHRHPSWNEGFLTTIKSKIVSNRNLLYCMQTKFNGCFMCTSSFEPKSEWLPPSISVPTNILHAITNSSLSASCLYDLNLSEEEINSGMCSESTLEDIRSNTQLSEISTDCLNEFLYKQSVPDKVIADCLEALLGVCVKNYGVQKSFEMLDYFGIYKDDNKQLLPNLLQIDLGNPLVMTNVKQSEVDSYLLNYEFLEANLKYSFKNRAYLLQALTHPSYPTNRLTGCYQQLEFIGDAVLDFLVSAFIFEKCKHMNPGDITDLRSALVNNVTLACVCVRNRFHQFMLYESPSLSDSIKKFVEFQNTQDHRVSSQVKILLEETSNANAFNMAQNIDVPKALGDILEAIIGAVFLDSSNDLLCTWRVVNALMDIELRDFIAEVPIDPVRQLYEYRGANPTFQINCIETDVVMMKCTFYCRDCVKTVVGCGGNKTMAKKASAKMALQILHTN